MQAKFDPGLQNLLNLPARTNRHLSGKVQNEIVESIPIRTVHCDTIQDVIDTNLPTILAFI